MKRIFILLILIVALSVSAFAQINNWFPETKIESALILNGNTLEITYSRPSLFSTGMGPPGKEKWKMIYIIRSDSIVYYATVNKTYKDTTYTKEIRAMIPVWDDTLKVNEFIFLWRH